jgi:hypothetical protein
VTDISDLPPRERAVHYRSMAEDADGYAKRSKGSARESYVLMARQWRQLADEADAMADRQERGS